MTREEAFALLGLSTGADNDAIRAAHAARVEPMLAKINQVPPRKQRTMREEIAQLDLARAAALGRKPGPTGRGKIVLLALLGALVLYVLIAQVGMRLFDRGRDDTPVQQKITQAEDASAVWLTFLSRSGMSDTELGRQAAATLAEAAEAREAGDMEKAERLYSAAWQGYFNALKSAGEEITAEWKRDVDQPWREVQSAFPFDPSVDFEIEVLMVARVIKPVEGLLWRVQPRMDAIAEARLGDQRFVELPDGYAAFVAACTRLRDALFIAGEEMPNVNFQLEFQHSDRYQRLEFQHEGVTIEGNQHATLVWTGAHAQSTLKLYPVAAPVKEFNFDSGWALLRMVQPAGPFSMDTGAPVWTLTNIAPDDPPRLALHIDRPHNPFDPSLYAAARLP